MSDSTQTSDVHSKQQEQWRSEIGFLGEMLGKTIHEQAGQQSFELVEEIRRLCWQRRTGNAKANSRLQKLFATLDETQCRVVIRAFTIFLDLLNVVEDRRRSEVLLQRSESAFPLTRSESIGQAFAELKSSGVADDEIHRLVDNLSIELVFTAHPTEAKRRSVRSKLRKIRELAASYHQETYSHRQAAIHDSIRRELTLLWQTDFIRPWRPSVMQEVARGLSIKSVLWEVIPQIAAEINMQSAALDGDNEQTPSPAIKFGSWIGGDRDGHPGVTADVTAETLGWLQTTAVEQHLKTCNELFESFTVSTRQADFGDEIVDAINQSLAAHPELPDLVAPIPPGEVVRRQLAIMRWKLVRTRDQADAKDAAVFSTDDDGLYQSADELLSDLHLVVRAIKKTATADLTVQPFIDWESRIKTFGLHFAILDVRQNSSVYSIVINELFTHFGLAKDPAALSEAERCELLANEAPALDDSADFGDETVETLALFKTLHQHAMTCGHDSLGAQIVSMTSCVSDILTVGWLWNLTRPADSRGGDSMDSYTPPLVPLLETVDDLRNGQQILDDLLSIESYRQQLTQHDGRQMIMLGYSDSTKDGGYLSACWALHECQRSLSRVAESHGVSLTFFHGRGGSLGRGGGPAARSILSLPRSTFDGTIRITEQGEVLAQRYDDPDIAHRHLEQMVWSSLLASGLPTSAPSGQWTEAMENLANSSRKKYRQLVESEHFVSFFRRVTPISEIEQLPIGSRPSRRKPGGGLSDLRAIPWVFSWTQCRCLLPAWFGFGSAIDELDADIDLLRQMHRDWPFFRAMVSNAELALSKADIEIMRAYFELAGQEAGLREIETMIVDEMQASRSAVLQITGNGELLGDTTWLKESIRVRNRFIDPLNLLQVEMMRRNLGEGETVDDEERHLMRLAINGVASGMRTSG